MVLPVLDDEIGRGLSWVVAGAIASFLLFYVLAPWAYALGPVALFLIAIPYLGFRWKQVMTSVDRESLTLVATFCSYFVVQAVILTFHGEKVSEYDLSFRYLAASVVLLFLLAVPVNGRHLLLVVGIGGVLTGGTALYQAGLESLSRIQSFDNPIHFGNGALALAILSLAGLFWVPAPNHALAWRALFATSVIGGTIASLLSGTRSGWVAIPIIAVVALVAFRDRLPPLKRALPIVLISGPLVFLVGEVGFVKERTTVAAEQFVDYFEKGQNHTSVGLRLDMYKAGLAIFSESPVIGVGPTRTEAAVDNLASEGAIHPSVARYRHLHNQYVDNLARYGLAGLAAYLTLLIIPFCLFYRKARHGSPAVRALGFSGALFLVLHAVVNLTQSMLERNIGAMMFVFVIVFLWVALKQEERLSAFSDRQHEHVKTQGASS